MNKFQIAHTDTAANIAILSTSCSKDIFWHASHAQIEEHHQQMQQHPATLWLTGYSGAGKSTLAYALEKRILAENHACCVLDGDNLRHHLNRDLGFSAQDRRENIRRAAEVARLMNDAGLMVITAFISPYREDRAMAREIIGADQFIEVHLSTSMDVCEERDPKGLYEKARSGKIPGFTGISSPYEAPLQADLTIDTAALSLEQATSLLYQNLAQRFY